jgi:hypothetical protein
VFVKHIVCGFIGFSDANFAYSGPALCKLPEVYLSLFTSSEAQRIAYEFTLASEA